MGVAGAALPAQRAIAAGVLCGAGEGECVGDHVRPVGVGAVPFDHGEFGGVERAGLAIAPDAGEIDDPGFAGREQFLGGEFGAGVEVERVFRTAFGPPRDGEAVEVGFVARRYLDGAAFDRDEALAREPAGQCGLDAIAADQERPTIGVDVGVPERATRIGLGHDFP